MGKDTTPIDPELERRLQLIEGALDGQEDLRGRDYVAVVAVAGALPLVLMVIGWLL
jgi:hypothetical protein